MKLYSFYQFMKTINGEKSEHGKFANNVINDLSFPQFSTSYNEISDYLEKNPYDETNLDTFDELFNDYENWLNY